MLLYEELRDHLIHSATLFKKKKHEGQISCFHTTTTLEKTTLNTQENER